jgi:hypothetical protein
MANRAKIRVPLRVDERVLVGAPAVMAMVAHVEAPVETAADDSRVETPTAECLVEKETEVAPTDVVAGPPSPQSLFRDHPDVPGEWIAAANKLRERNEGCCFLMLRVAATNESETPTQAISKKSLSKHSDATIKALCLDCLSSKLIATGGGRSDQQYSLQNFETSHLQGARHKRAAGTLAKYDAIAEAGPEESDPEYFCFVRSLNLRRLGDDAQFAVSLFT